MSFGFPGVLPAPEENALGPGTLSRQGEGYRVLCPSGWALWQRSPGQLGGFLSAAAQQVPLLTNGSGCRSSLIIIPRLNPSWLLLAQAPLDCSFLGGGCGCGRAEFSLAVLAASLPFPWSCVVLHLPPIALNLHMFHGGLDSKRAEWLGLTSIHFREALWRNWFTQSLQDQVSFVLISALRIYHLTQLLIVYVYELPSCETYCCFI